MTIRGRPISSRSSPPPCCRSGAIEIGRSVRHEAVSDFRWNASRCRNIVDELGLLVRAAARRPPSAVLPLRLRRHVHPPLTAGSRWDRRRKARAMGSAPPRFENGSSRDALAQPPGSADARNCSVTTPSRLRNRSRPARARHILPRGGDGTSLVGVSLGGVQRSSVLGMNGMGVVCEATHVGLGKRVAIS